MSIVPSSAKISGIKRHSYWSSWRDVAHSVDYHALMEQSDDSAAMDVCDTEADVNNSIDECYDVESDDLQSYKVFFECSDIEQDGVGDHSDSSSYNTDDYSDENL